MAAEAKKDRTFPNLNGTGGGGGREDEDEEGQSGIWQGRAYIDFEDDDSIPCQTVYSFLRDCLQHPKILLHQELEFFRNYLSELGLSFEMPAEAPYKEGHQDDTFCLDRGDKWLQDLKKRVCQNQADEEEYYWASIIPVKRKSYIGVVIFRFEPHPLSIDLLQAYVAYCREKADDYDQYIKDFLDHFDLTRNLDVEVRLKEAVDASEWRKRNNLKEPNRFELMYLFKRQPNDTSTSLVAQKPKTKSTSASGSGVTSNVTNKKSSRERNHVRNDHSHSDIDSNSSGSASDSDSSSTSGESESSSGSEFNGKYTIRKHKKKKVGRPKVSRKSHTSSKSLRRRAAAIEEKLKRQYNLREVRIILERCDHLLKSSIKTTSAAMSSVSVPCRSFNKNKMKQSLQAVAKNIVQNSTRTGSTPSSKSRDGLSLGPINGRRKSPILITLDDEDESFITIVGSKAEPSSTPSPLSEIENKNPPSSSPPSSSSLDNGYASSESLTRTKEVGKFVVATASTTPKLNGSLSSNTEDKTKTTRNTVLRKRPAPIASPSTIRENTKKQKYPGTVKVIKVQKPGGNEQQDFKKSLRKPSEYSCEVCWFGTSFPTQELLDNHMKNKHSSKRELISCACGRKFTKPSLEAHQVLCPVTIDKRFNRRV